MDLKRCLLDTVMHSFAAGMGVGLASCGFAGGWPWLALTLLVLAVVNGACALRGTHAVVRGIEAVPQEPSR